MTESYREMEERHAAMDDREYEQDNVTPWAGPDEYQTVADPEPAAVHDCANCRYAKGDAAPYWCIALVMLVFGDGKRACSGWPWDPAEVRH